MTDKFQRDIFIDEIYNAALNDRDIYFISADFGAPSLDKFRDKLPNQFIHSGISEQHMIDMAAGLALSNKKVYLYAMAPFITLRCLEQIKCSLSMMNLPVTILAVGVGLGYADAGPTHYANEDVACLRSLPGIEIFSISDEITAKAIAQNTLNEPKFRIIRMERHALPQIHSKVIDSINNGFEVLNKGNKVCILSYGHLLHRAKLALEILNKEEKNIGLIDVYRFKPLSKNLLTELNKYESLITIEEQCLDGGFGSCILEFLNKNKILKNIDRMGLPERYFFENGGREYLLDTFGLSVDDIVNRIKINNI